MRRRTLLAVLLGIPVAAWAGLDDWLKEQLRHESKNALDPATAAAGLRQALEAGTQLAVNQLGREDGYFANARVKIPLPDSLRRMERTLRKLGQGETADALILSMNRAAETAAPEARAVFLHAIRQMSVQDAVGIVRGADDAATAYFRRHTEATLLQRFRPVVAASTDRVAVMQRYKKFLRDAGPVAALFDTASLDIDEYVTRKALDGLFVLVADEERRIRHDPVARSTELLRTVFGQ